MSPLFRLFHAPEWIDIECRKTRTESMCHFDNSMYLLYGKYIRKPNRNHLTMAMRKYRAAVCVRRKALAPFIPKATLTGIIVDIFMKLTLLHCYKILHILTIFASYAQVSWIMASTLSPPRSGQSMSEPATEFTAIAAAAAAVFYRCKRSNSGVMASTILTIQTNRINFIEKRVRAPTIKQIRREKLHCSVVCVRECAYHSNVYTKKRYIDTFKK